MPNRFHIHIRYLKQNKILHASCFNLFHYNTNKHIQGHKDELLQKISEQIQKLKEKKFQSQEQKDRAIQSVIKGVAVGVTPLLINGLIMLGVYSIGFTTAGIAAGSIAAGIQATAIGGAIQAGSLFAGLQSVGAIGVGVASLPVLIGSGLVLGIGYGLFSYFKKKQK